MAEEKVNRKKYAATPVTKIKEQELIAVKPKYNENNGERLPFHSIEQGKNKFRIFPAHEDDVSFTHQKVTIFLEIPIETTENGKKKIEIKNKPIFNARVHGNYQKDLVEEYITFTAKTLKDEIEDESILKDRLATLFGDFNTKKKGLKYNFNEICYANKITVVVEKDAKGKDVLKADGEPKRVNSKLFGFWEFYPIVKKQLNKMNVEDDDPDAPISTDPFTDPDTGKWVQIEYNKEAPNPNDKYSTVLQPKGESPLTDEELEMFDKVESLTKLFSNVYKRRDFDLALAGLQLFDRKNNFRTFENDDFLEIVENLRAEIPSEEEEKEAQTKAAAKTTNVTKAKKEKEPLFDEFDDMDRDALKRYLAKNKEELGIISIKTNFSDDHIRELIRERKKELAALEEEVEEEVEEEIVEEEEEVEEEVVETEEEEEVEEEPTTNSKTRDKYKTPTTVKEKELTDDEVVFGRNLTKEDLDYSKVTPETPTKIEGVSKSKLQELRDKKAKK